MVHVLYCYLLCNVFFVLFTRFPNLRCSFDWGLYLAISLQRQSEDSSLKFLFFVLLKAANFSWLAFRALFVLCSLLWFAGAAAR